MELYGMRTYGMGIYCLRISRNISQNYFKTDLEETLHPVTPCDLLLGGPAIRPVVFCLWRFYNIYFAKNIAFGNCVFHIGILAIIACVVHNYLVHFLFL